MKEYVESLLFYEQNWKKNFTRYAQKMYLYQ